MSKAILKITGKIDAITMGDEKDTIKVLTKHQSFEVEMQHGKIVEADIGKMLAIHANASKFGNKLIVKKYRVIADPTLDNLSDYELEDILVSYGYDYNDLEGLGSTELRQRIENNTSYLTDARAMPINTFATKSVIKKNEDGNYFLATIPNIFVSGTFIQKHQKIVDALVESNKIVRITGYLVNNNGVLNVIIKHAHIQL